jgi:hypothetical protein
MNLNINFSKKYTPETNFYLWVNEEWKDENKIPDDYQNWGAFNSLEQENKLKIKNLLEKGDVDIKCKILYEQGLDRKNTNEINKFLDEIQNCSKIDILLNKSIALYLMFHINHPINFSVYSDLIDSDINILHLDTDGLELPDRDYYFLKSKNKERNEYKTFLRKYADYFNLFKLDTESIYNIELELAEVTLTNVQKRNIDLQNNPTELSELLKKYPSFTFLKYFKKGKINITNPKFCQKFNELLISNKYSLQVWKDFFKMKVLLSVSSYLSEEVENIYFNFFSKILSGTPKMKPLWKRSLNTVESKLGFLVGKSFVNKYFNEKSKSRSLEIIKYLKLDLHNRMKTLNWMDDLTKTKALEKLDNMVVKVGYPDKWREYNVDIKKENSYFKNIILCNIDDSDYSFSKLYQKVDRTEWHMNPQMVNAYYSPSSNEIVFPAGILQPPFFSENYDTALNFGGIGMVIGHEMTHGFDDEGCKFDAKGNLNNWWSPKDYKKYKEKTDLIKQQYNKYSIDGESINGELTLGENIADLGGITIALESLKKYLKENPSENKLIDNLSPIQRFFINYARIWRCNTRPEEIKHRLLVDPHSPPELRVNGILKNIDDFYKHFNIKTDLIIRAKIW